MTTSLLIQLASKLMLAAEAESKRLDWWDDARRLRRWSRSVGRRTESRFLSVKR